MQESESDLGPIPPSEETGIFLDVPHDVYHRRQLRTVSKSALDQVAQSPAHYHWWLYHPDPEPTPALEFGTALHMLILEPERFNRTYATRPDFGDGRTAKAKAAKLEWESQNEGKLVLSRADERALLGMHESVMTHPAASALIVDGEAEVTLRWKDPVTGLASKLRADWWPKRKSIVVDLKSARNAGPDEFQKDAYRYGYHRQSALYRYGFAECGVPIEHYAILAVEKEPPYLCAVYVLDEEATAKGFSSVRRDIDRLADCIERDKFEGYSDGVLTLSLPSWAA